MVATAESLADRHEGHAGELGGEVHGDLTGESDILHATLGRHVRHLDAIVLGDLTLDDFGREGVAGFLDEDVMEQLLDLGEFEGLAGHTGQTDDTGDGAFEITDITGNTGGDELGDLGLEVEATGGGLLAEDGDAGLEAGGLDGSDHAPLEAGDEAFLKLGDLGSRAVAREDHLLMVVMQLVEGVEELVLRGFLASEEMDVVDQEQVEFAVTAAERGDAAGLEGLNEIVGESLGGDVGDASLRIAGVDRVGDRVHQVGLTETGRTVDEERVIVVARFLGDSERSAVGHLVFRTNDEIIKRVVRLDRRSRRSGGGLTRRTRDRSGSRSGFARSVNRSGQTEIHIAAGDERELATEHLGVVAVHPGFGEHGRSFQHENLALDNAQGLQRRDPSFEVRARKGVTEFAFCGLPKG